MPDTPNPYAHLDDQSSDVLGDWRGAAWALQDWLFANYGIRENNRHRLGDLLGRLHEHRYVLVAPEHVASNETDDDWHTYFDPKDDRMSSIIHKPRPLAAMDLQGIACPCCDALPVSGTVDWRDEGSFQAISVLTFRCARGHVSVHESDIVA